MSADVCPGCGRPKAPSDCEECGRPQSEPPRPDPAVRLLYVLVGGAFLAALILYGVRFSGPLSTKGATWAQFGDYFGGVLNPIVGLAALIALLWTLKLQRKELRTSVDELRKTAEAATAQATTAGHQAEIMIRSARVHGLAHMERWRSKIPNSTEGKQLAAEVAELGQLLKRLRRQEAVKSGMTERAERED